MNNYEGIILINKDIDKKEIKYTIIPALIEIITKDGKFEKIEDLGIRTLAYEIKKNKEARYLDFKFKSTEKIISKLEKYIRANDSIIKYIIVRGDE